MIVCDNGPPGVTVIDGVSGVVEPDGQIRNSPADVEAAITVRVTALAPTGTPAVPAMVIDRFRLADNF